MAKEIWNKPIDKTIDWGGDESTDFAPVSGEMVQKFIKDTFDEKFGYCRVVKEIAQFFASQDDAKLYDKDTSANAGLLLNSIKLATNSTIQYYVRINNNLDSRTFATSVGKPCYIKFTFQSQIKQNPDLPYEDTMERGFVEVFTRLSGREYGDPVMSFYCVSGEMTTIDVSQYLVSGDNDVMIRITGETTLETAPALTYTVTLTSLSITANNFEWWKPFSSDINIPFIISGNIDKTLKVNVINELSGTVTPYEVSLGKSVYTDSAYGFVVPHPGTGVFKISAYVENTAGTITTDKVEFNVNCINEGENVKLVAINNMINKLTNWSDNTVFEYSIYDGGKSVSDIKFIYYKDGEILNIVDNNSVVTGTKNTFNIPLELDTLDNSNFEISVDVRDNRVSYYNYIFDVDNSLGYSAMPGAVFYMNPKTRNNSQGNREDVINEINGGTITATWKNVGWDSDGWSTDESGNKSLRLFAGSSATINYKPFEIEGARNGKTIELDFCINNVSDETASAINIMNNNVGIKITPNKVEAYSQVLKNENTQSVSIQDGERIRLHYVIMPNAYGNNGFNLCFIYINGVKNRTFVYESNDYFYSSANIELGCTGADMDIYGIRVYNTALSSSGVLTNLINWETSQDERKKLSEKNDVFNADGSEIDFNKIKGVMNVFTYSGDIPSYTNKDVKVKGDLEVFWAEHPEWNSVVRDCKAEGQGTSSKKYFKWNFRWKLKKETIEYADGSKPTSGKWRFVPGQPSISKATAKLNWASSMQSHKIGSVNSITELSELMGIINEANARVSVYQYPFVGFEKSVNEEGETVYKFLGIYTFGPDKGDDNTFGYDDDKYPELISVEGADNAPLPALFRVPWTDRMIFDEEEESFAYNGEYCWDFNAGDLGKIDSFIQAYNFVYECSPRLLPFDGTLDELNSQIKDHKDLGVDFWLTKDNDTVVYYEAGESKFIYADTGNGPISLKEQLLDKDYGLSTVDLSNDINIRNEQYINARISKFRKEMEQYWVLDDSIFQRNWVEFNAATDNRAKNTYPYTFLNRYRWRSDDTDTIWPINNQGQSSKGYWVEIHDRYDNGGPVWNGETSNFWNLLDLAFPEEIRKGMCSFMEAMEELSGLSKGNSYDKLYGFFKKYYFNNAQEYFPQTLYNTTAKELYETAKIAQQKGTYTNDTDPITQSLGDHYSAERRWISKRIPYMMSKYGYGDFSNGGADAIIVRIAGDTISYDITPAIWMYPCIAHGTSLVQGERTPAGETCHIDINMGGSADQQNAILGAHYLQDIGDWYDKRVDGTMVVTGKMLTELKLGHKSKDIVISISGLTISNTPALKHLMLSRISTLKGTLDLSGCKRLEKCYLDGTGITQPKFATGCGLKIVEFGSETNYIIFKNMPLLQNSGVNINACKKAITDFAVTDCANFDPVNMLYEIYSTQQRYGFNLKRIRCVGFDENVPDDVINMIYEMTKGEFFGMDSEGVGTSGLPVFEGHIHVSNVAERNLEIINRAFPQLEVSFDKLVRPTGFTLKYTGASTFYENDDNIVLTASSSNDAYPEVRWVIKNYRDFYFDDISIDEYTGKVTLHAPVTNESFNKTIDIRAVSTHNSDIYVDRTINFIGTKVTTMSIENDGIVSTGTKLTAKLGPSSHTKPHVINWTCDKDGVNIDENGIVSIFTGDTCVITVTASYGLDDTVSVQKTFLINDSIIATTETNPELMRVAYTNMWCADRTQLYASEAFAVKNIDGVFVGTDIINLDELQYFGMTSLTSNTFNSCVQLKRLVIPKHVKSFDSFTRNELELDFIDIRCKNFNCVATSKISVKELIIHHDVVNSETYPFVGVESLKILSGVTTIPLIHSDVLSEVDIPSTVNDILGFGPRNDVSSFNIVFNIEDGSIFKESNGYLTNVDNTAIYKCNITGSITIDDNFTKIYNYAFACCDDVVCGDYIEHIGKYAFYNTHVNIHEIKDVNSHSFDKSIITNNTGEIYITGTISGKVFVNATFDGISTLHINCKFDDDFLANTNYTDNLTIYLDKSTEFIGEDIKDVTGCKNITIENTTVIYNGSLSSYLKTDYIGLITNGANLSYTSQRSSVIEIPSDTKDIANGVFFNSNWAENGISSQHNNVNVGKYAFYNANVKLIEGKFGNIDVYAFANSNINGNIIFDKCTYIGEHAFENCKQLSNITLPEGLTTISTNCFNGASSLTDIVLPSTITYINERAFSGCYLVKNFTCKPKNAPGLNDKAFGDKDSFMGRLVTNKKLFIPINSTGYDNSYWETTLCNPNSCDYQRDIIYEPLTCVNLAITADDVDAHETQTTIYYIAETNGFDPCSNKNVNGIILTGRVLSEPFEQNTSTTDTVTRTITFEYLGVTVSTTITQDVYKDKYFVVNLNNEWRLNEKDNMNPNPNIYKGLYESFSNHYIHDSIATMYIDIHGYDTFSLLVRSYGESRYDYLVVSELDTEIDLETSSTIKYSTKDKPSNITDISGYTNVIFEGIGGGNHRITIIYRKDISTSTDPDRGYVLINKNQ